MLRTGGLGARRAAPIALVPAPSHCISISAAAQLSGPYWPVDTPLPPDLASSPRRTRVANNVKRPRLGVYGCPGFHLVSSLASRRSDCQILHSKCKKREPLQATTRETRKQRRLCRSSHSHWLLYSTLQLWRMWMPWAAVKIEQSPFRECSWCLSLPKFPLSGLHGRPNVLLAALHFW